jgi:hypothetical protein
MQGLERDDLATLAAAGVLTYIAEAMLHEAVGHGGMCMAQGLHFTMLAPLWMRCSEFSTSVVAAGPAMNVVSATIFCALLRWAMPASVMASLLLWLAFAFNALVACGYLAVGAASGFGDWPALFASVQPSIAWRLPAGLIAVAGYFGCLRLAAISFRRFSGGGRIAAARLRRRALVPGAAAAVVACAAEIFGGRLQATGLLLAIGCTLVVGFSLTSMGDVVSVPAPGDRDLGIIARSHWLIGTALVITLLFVTVIGPGLELAPP